jgi:hypothetical protein
MVVLLELLLVLSRASFQDPFELLNLLMNIYSDYKSQITNNSCKHLPFHPPPTPPAQDLPIKIPIILCTNDPRTARRPILTC